MNHETPCRNHIRLQVNERLMKTASPVAGCSIDGSYDGVAREHSPCRPSFVPLLRENGRKRKLVLHFDIRNTVLVADSVTNVTVEQALNSFLTGVTWGKDDQDGEWVWHSKEPSLVPPRPDSITFYKYLERTLVRTPMDRTELRIATGDFVHRPLGEEFLPYFENRLALLKWNYPYVQARDECLTMRGKDGQPYHYILPSLYNLIHSLVQRNRDFAIVIRTYGLDCANVLKSLSYGLKGNHPGFPSPVNLAVDLTPGSIIRSSNDSACLETYSSRKESDSKMTNLFTCKSGDKTRPGGNVPCQVVHKLYHERDIYRFVSKLQGISGFVDDFRYWQSNSYSYSAGKPFWIDGSDVGVHHIIFDDNFRSYEEDSIVDVRKFEESKQIARRLSKQEIAEFEDVCLVQADLLQSVEDQDYFINKVHVCENNYSKFLKQGKL
ncbi:uncharacterized protein LOC121369491 [Gigantopelta aegis]|uniref:uncharacterized protein LOC121369491 n=1 Tax=Gigantopelta aegis TaxID=1735272 RepID=UPI001B88E46A|nr:uncharacterized protein LOC121369491 [Gigantopelta aegis]